MRLISLYQNLADSNNSLAQWESRLEDDFTIKPKSKLALINCNLKYNNNYITVNQASSQFALYLTKTNIDSDTFNVCTVPTGKYNTASFINEVQKAINQGIEYNVFDTNPTTLGVASQLFIDSNQLVNIQFDKSIFQKIVSTKATTNIDTTGNNLEREAGIGSNNWAAYSEIGYNDTTKGIQRVPVCKGTFECSIRIVNISSTKQFIFGLVNEQVNFDLGQELTEDKYSVYIGNTENDNLYVINGVKTNVFVTNGDIITMTLNNGIISFEITGGGGDQLPENFFNFRSNQGTINNFLYVSLYGTASEVSLAESTTAASIFNYQPDPFFKIPQPTPLELQTINFRIKMDFRRIDDFNDLWAILGYSGPVLGENTSSSTFTATSKLDFEVTEDQGCNLIIDNLPLVSYNFNDVVSKKQPILYTIPSGERDALGILSYSTNYPVPIHLNNQYELNIKNLRFSIRNAKDNAVESIDEASLSIALLDENE